MTMESIITVVTAFLTYAFGILAKKFNWIDTKYIPIQNMLIGLLAGLLSYCTGLTDNVLVAIILCEASALGAGGAYDVVRTQKE